MSKSVEGQPISQGEENPIYCIVPLFPCGTLVKPIYGSIEGMITAQSLRFGKAQYEVSYFNNGEQKCIWMNENEFIADIEKRIIGFYRPT